MKDKLKQVLLEYIPWDAQEAICRQQLLQLLDTEINLFSREHVHMHMCASAWIVNADFTKVLMVYHNLYDSWSWCGGHFENDMDLQHTAYREAIEETHIHALRLLQDNLFSMEALPVKQHYKNNQCIQSHVHYNLTYLYQGDETAYVEPCIKENRAVMWIPISQLTSYVKEPHMLNIYQKLNKKLVCMYKLDEIDHHKNVSPII